MKRFSLMPSGFVALMCVVFAPCGLAVPQYTVVDLGPTAAYGAYIGVGGVARQVGYGPLASNALVWSSSSANPVNLHPAGYLISAAIGGYVSGGVEYQFGFVDTGSTSYAALWSGSAASFVNLGRAADTGFNNASVSGGYAVPGGGGRQVGTDAANHAVMWAGTAASMVDLTPDGATQALAEGGYWTASGGRQVGKVDGHAFVWSGTANSGVDFHPSQYQTSNMNGGALTPGGGEWMVGTGDNHALLWRGSPTDVVDLTPGSMQFAEALATNGTTIVGLSGVTVNAAPHATVWTGPDASTAFDLGSLLPGGYTRSVAYGIDAQGNIVGYASDASGRTQHGFLWAVPEPSTLCWMALGSLGFARRRRKPVAADRSYRAGAATLFGVELMNGDGASCM